MLFTDPIFLFYFLPLALILHRFSIIRVGRKYGNLPRILLLSLTLIFYGIEYPWWLIPFGVSIVVDYSLASLLMREQRPPIRKLLVCISVFQLLSILAIFKYWNFLIVNLGRLMPEWAEWLPQIAVNDHPLPLPAGVSFYIFESLSFVIDVYRRKVKAPKNPLRFLAFIAMFPRFIAGPIVRYGDMSRQFDDYRGMRLEKGMYLFAIGIFLKTCFGDQFGTFVEMAFSRWEGLGMGNAWVGVIAYTMQLYFDFSGYSLMAIGLGHCLGFHFTTNFNRPYLATSLQEFWHRWHISLSTWLRDYLYVSLGGNRQGKIRTYVNIFLTMVIGGFWHGAAWVFILWGAWHGFFLVLERVLNFPTKKMPSWMGQLVTLLIAVIGWVFFKASGYRHALTILNAMFNPLHSGPPLEVEFLSRHLMSIVFCFAGLLYGFWIERYIDYEKLGSPLWVSWRQRAAAMSMLAFALIIAFSGNKLPFLYYQF